MSFDVLISRLQNRFDTLSNRLQQATRYALEHPNEIALETITVLAKRAGVQPSVFVRLSQAFGFSGFTEFQKVFQSALADRASSYGERIRQLKESTEREAPSKTNDLLRQFCELNAASLLHLAGNLDNGTLQAAAGLVGNADIIHIVGERRSFTIAVYLAYAFTRTGKKNRLLAGSGGTLRDEIKTMGSKDVLLAIGMHPYSSGTLEAVNWAAENKIPIIAMTDGQLTPVSKHADIVLEVRDADFLGFRSIVAQMCLAQALIISVADASE